jgi:hypothetical protein
VQQRVRGMEHPAGCSPTTCGCGLGALLQARVSREPHHQPRQHRPHGGLLQSRDDCRLHGRPRHRHAAVPHAGATKGMNWLCMFSLLCSTGGTAVPTWTPKPGSGCRRWKTKTKTKQARRRGKRRGGLGTVHGSVDWLGKCCTTIWCCHIQGLLSLFWPFRSLAATGISAKAEAAARGPVGLRGSHGPYTVARSIGSAWSVLASSLTSHKQIRTMKTSTSRGKEDGEEERAGDSRSSSRSAS